MRIKVFSVSRERFDKSSINFEKFMVRLFACFFCSLIIVQIAMTSNTVRNILTLGSDLDGRALAVNEFMFNEGKLRLQLIGIEPNDQLKLLLNGEVAAIFNTNIIEIRVKDGDALGVNCKDSKYKGEIEIVSKSPNIMTNCVGKRFKTDGDPRGNLHIRVGK